MLKQLAGRFRAGSLKVQESSCLVLGLVPWRMVHRMLIDGDEDDLGHHTV